MVSIPRLNRIQPSADRPTGRIKFKAKDRASSITGRTGALSNLAQEGGKIANAYENEEIDSKSTQDEAEYTVWKAQALDVIKENKGDPTKLYADHDLADEEKRREILGRHKDLSERAIRGITSNFKKVEDSERLTTLNQRGRQKAIFKNNLVKTNLELRGKNLSLKASSVVPGKEGSFFFYGKNIHDITTILAKQGIDNGSVEVLGKDDKRKPTHEFLDADKNVVRVLFNKTSALELNQELDKRITTSIENLIASGNSDKAVAIQERYSKSIHPDNHARITKALKVNKDSDESFKVVEGLIGKSKDERNKILKKLTPEVRHKVKRLEESNAKLRNIQRSRRFKVNHEALDKFVDSSDVHSFEALTNTPQYKKLWPNLDRKGRDAIKDAFNPPTETDPKAMITYQDLKDGLNPKFKIETMTNAEHSLFLVGLNKGDKSKAWTYKNSLNKKDEASLGEINTFNNNVGGIFKEVLIAKEMVRKNPFGSGLDEQSIIDYNRGRQDLRIFMSNVDPKTPAHKVSELINEFLNTKVANDIFGRGNGWKTQAIPKPSDIKPRTIPSGTPRTSRSKQPDPLIGKSADEVNRLLLRYKFKFPKRNGGEMPDTKDPIFLKFVKGDN